MKAFTFLGRGPLYKSNYIFDNQECETQFFAEAIVKFFSPKSLYFFATESAAREPVSDNNTCERLSYLEKLLSKETQVVHIPIKEGTNEIELWDIFKTVVDNIHDTDTVLFDITHGFRSLPFLTFLALAYVSNVKSGVKIERVIYGAYEAVERNNPNKPVFDLTPFISLLRWMNAVNVFQNYGDARPIADLEVQTDIANALNNLSEALLTNRTLEAQKAAMIFNGLSFDNSQAPPFQMLVDQLKQNYQSMAVNEPSNNPPNSLKAQYLQIKWYIENQHYLQAITLMREWLISYKCQQDGNEHWLSYKNRNTAEKALGERKKQQNSQLAQGLSTLLTDQTLIKLWDQCVAIRNDLAHCGMLNNPKPKSATEAIQASQELFNKFEEFVSSQEM